MVCGSYATRMAVMRGITHGPVLGPILSSFFTADVDEVMEGLLIRLWMTPSRGEQSICSRAGLPVTQTKVGQVETAGTSARTNTTSCPGTPRPHQQDQDGLGPDHCRSGPGGPGRQRGDTSEEHTLAAVSQLGGRRGWQSSASSAGHTRWAEP